MTTATIKRIKRVEPGEYNVTTTTGEYRISNRFGGKWQICEMSDGETTSEGWGFYWYETLRDAKYAVVEW